MKTLKTVALLVCAWPAVATAQVRASELATMSQMIDGTRITVTYSRPRARGRKVLFGNPKAVRWDEVWTPGANYATTLETSKQIRLDGHPVKAGTYSVWMVVRKTGDWTMVLDPKAKLYHMEPPDSSATQIRFPIKTRTAPYLDVLSWSMPELRVSGGTLAMQWGTTKVAMRLDVEPSYSVSTPENDARAYVGAYDYVENYNGKETRKKLNVFYEKGMLRGTFDPKDDYMDRFVLIRLQPDWFAPGLFDEKGELYEVMKPDMTFEFARDGGRVVRFDVRGDDDKIFASGTRKPD